MSLRLYDTGTRSVRGFEPLDPPKVTVYLCGDTVYAPPHLGHARSKVIFDVLWRWLERSGYDVVFARNVTDVDDKIIVRAAEEGVTWWQVSQLVIHQMARAYDLLGLRPPTVEPLTTGHITQMIELTQRLIDGEHAYASGGDVYFDVRSLPEYGALSGQRPDQMIETEKTDPDRPKRDLLDFALWKGSRPGEPSWPTPWGRAGLAGTWGARRWRRRTSVRRSTFTAAAPTSCSRTTRTSWHNPAARATGSRVTGCTTGC